MKDTVITDANVRWKMKWDVSVHRDKPPVEDMFEEGPALARLLAADVIFLNDHWWEDGWPAAAKAITSLIVNCNDIFAWGAADGEEVLYAELEDLYTHWEKDPQWGAAMWCIKKRKQLPQKPVLDAIREAGIWNIEDVLK